MRSYIAPFHVMEVQTAARALEAAGRTRHPHGDRRTRFPDAGSRCIDAARRALVDGGDIYYTSALGLPALREAIARHYADHYGVDVAPDGSSSPPGRRPHCCW